MSERKKNDKKAKTTTPKTSEKKEKAKKASPKSKAAQPKTTTAKKTVKRTVSKAKTSRKSSTPVKAPKRSATKATGKKQKRVQKQEEIREPQPPKEFMEELERQAAINGLINSLPDPHSVVKAKKKNNREVNIPKGAVVKDIRIHYKFE